MRQHFFIFGLYKTGHVICILKFPPGYDPAHVFVMLLESPKINIERLLKKFGLPAVTSKLHTAHVLKFCFCRLMYCDIVSNKIYFPPNRTSCRFYRSMYENAIRNRN